MTTTIITPNPLSSDTEFNRYYHYDIPGAELSDLQDELYCLRPLLWGLPQNHWLRERVSQLQAEITKRKYSGHDLPQGKPKVKPKRLAEGVKL